MTGPEHPPRPPSHADPSLITTREGGSRGHRMSPPRMLAQTVARRAARLGRMARPGPRAILGFTAGALAAVAGFIAYAEGGRGAVAAVVAAFVTGLIVGSLGRSR